MEDDASGERRIQRPLSSLNGTSSVTLPPELLAEAARRLGWLGLVYAFGGLVGHFGRRLLMTWSGALDASLHANDVTAALGVVLGVAVYAAARSGAFSPRRLIDYSPAFEVAGAFVIAANQFLGPATGLPDVGITLVSAECVWIMAFPLVVPNTPRNVLIASLLAASMGPALYGASVVFSKVPAAGPLELVSYFLPNYLIVAVAYEFARMMQRYNVRLKRAREIGSYELLERIGEGGMGEVWRARHRLLARPAALKLIRAEALGANHRSREAVLHRFEREARDTAMLGSTHTIDVYDFGVTEDGNFYYVMELLDGLSLERYVQQFGPMEPARVVYLLQQVCHSLGEAHARGFVHRDVKPANIFMCRLGPDVDFIKVLDFGLVKHLDSAAEQMLTTEGTTAGTPAYMAPEVALGRGDVDGRADLYAVGCVAYFLLTGQPLFSRESAVATALAHVNDPPVPPSQRSELPVPAALDALILDCLAKDPAARPATATALAHRLATAVPDTWESDKAQAWWNLRQSSPEPGDVSAERESVDAAASHAPRCWPKLDRRSARQQPA